MKWILNSNKFKWIKQHDSMQCGGSHNSLIEKREHTTLWSRINLSSETDKCNIK